MKMIPNERMKDTGVDKMEFQNLYKKEKTKTKKHA
jgi:hypothetical protein